MSGWITKYLCSDLSFYLCCVIFVFMLVSRVKLKRQKQIAQSAKATYKNKNNFLCHKSYKKQRGLPKPHTHSFQPAFTVVLNPSILNTHGS